MAVVYVADRERALIAGRIPLQLDKSAGQKPLVESGRGSEGLIVEARVDLVAEEDKEATTAIHKGFQLLHRSGGQCLDVGQDDQRIAVEVLACQTCRSGHVHLDR